MWQNCICKRIHPSYSHKLRNMRIRRCGILLGIQSLARYSFAFQSLQITRSKFLMASSLMPFSTNGWSSKQQQHQNGDPRAQAASFMTKKFPEGQDEKKGREKDNTSPSEDVLEEFKAENNFDGTLSIVVFGASGDLAKKMTFPALFELFANGFIPEDVVLVGYARSDMTVDDLKDQLREKLEKAADEMDDGESKLDSFWKQLKYVQGDQKKEAMENLASSLADWENEVSEEAARKDKSCGSCHNRLYYFAIPPAVYVDYADSVKAKGLSDSGFTRLVIEKPFGRDLQSAKEQTRELQNILDEKYIFRIDHFIAMEMVQNLLTFRFANLIMEPVWNRNYIESVTLNMKEDFGTAGRGAYFDKFGMIRDVIQNHLMQVVSLIAMEAPVGVDDSNSVRDEKVKVLRSMRSVSMDDVVLGQYTGNDKQGGYRDNDDVPDDSVTETFGAMALYIDNNRWEGVPFILRAGKALDENLIEVRIKFRKPPALTRLFGCDSCSGDELVLQVQPEEKMFWNLNVKAPGLKNKPMRADLNGFEYRAAYQPSPYVRLLIEVLRGNQATFVRSDELIEAWRILSPLVDEMEKAKDGDKSAAKKLNLQYYKFGTVQDFMSGPETVRDLV